MDKEILKVSYNELLKRYKKAERFMNDESIPVAEKEKYVFTLKGITDELGKILQQIGYYTDKESMNGFVIHERKGA